MTKDNELSGTTEELPPLKLADGDWEANYNVRDFIEKLLDASPHVEITDADVGPNDSGLGITIDGAPFSIRIKPRPINPRPIR